MVRTRRADSVVCRRFGKHSLVLCDRAIEYRKVARVSVINERREVTNERRIFLFDRWVLITPIVSRGAGNGRV
jgi:hypothetical protein